MRFPMKPSRFPHTTPTLLIRFARSTMVSSTSCAVFAPRTISNSRITLAGGEKCMPTTSPGRAGEAANSAMDREEGFGGGNAPLLAALFGLGETHLLVGH